MTARDGVDQAATVGGAALLVLDADGLDRLELVLGGWLPESALPAAAWREAPGDVVLTDPENTPLARVRPGLTPDDLPMVEPLAPLPRGLGPHWDAAVRLSAAATRARIGGGTQAITAIIVDVVPTRADQATALRVGAGPDPVIVLVGVRRGARHPADVGWAGLTRAAWGLADAIEAVDPGRPVIRLVLPWPAERTPDLGRGAVATCTAVSTWQADGERVPDPELIVERELDAHYPPASARELLRARRAVGGPGAVVFFTGLSGSGKSTIARALADELADAVPRRVTLLDGDGVRQHLSRGLGFDAQSRAINIDRIAWVASLVAAHGGIAIAAPIAPFADGRRAARAMVGGDAVFLLVHVSTPLDVCEARDRKGLYARARAGQVPEFTGISSPYEVPDDADVTVDTTDMPVEEAVRLVREALERHLDDAAGR
jgi:sulfate adenylyltransferase